MPFGADRSAVIPGAVRIVLPHDHPIRADEVGRRAVLANACAAEVDPAADPFRRGVAMDAGQRRAVDELRDLASADVV